MKKGINNVIICFSTLITAPLFSMAVSPVSVASSNGYGNDENPPGYNLENALDLLNEQIQENKKRANDCMRSNPIFQKLHLEEKDRSYIRYLLISLYTCNDTLQFARKMNYPTEINRIQKTIETRMGYLRDLLRRYAEYELEKSPLDNETKKQLQFLEKNADKVAHHLSENYNRCASSCQKLKGA